MLAFAIGIQQAHAQDATALASRYELVRDQLYGNAYQRPLYVESTDDAQTLKGSVYAIVERPYQEVGAALANVGHWCDILILHLNVKGCRTSVTDTGSQILLNIGRKFEQSLADTHSLQLSFRLLSTAPNYALLTMDAEKGPLGTGNYKILLEVAAIEGARSFIHFFYSYRVSAMARVAMRMYVNTLGRNKVGFSIVGRHADGQPRYVGKMRGVVERNAMRYYLAIDAYIGALTVPAPQRQEKRLQDWHTAVEHYPDQLHELEREEYVTMKRREIDRQRGG